ncbi:MAG: transglutaminase-like domain-containing protein, partial [Chloroflexi bacterium]|nr:transglutaminase-like domain-containing protein [Chloroflexota bacterium]
MAETFSQAVAMPDDNINLAEAALLIAAETYPGLAVAHYLRRLDELAAGIAPSLRGLRRVGSASERRAVLRCLNESLFGAHGFCGNRKDYYDPRNSYLNQVLDRRTGIPITLSVVYLEVGWRLGLPLAGVGLPAHFMVRWVGAGEPLLVDPFGGGVLLDVEGCQD